MKTKKSTFSVGKTSVGIAAFILFLASCQKDNDILSATDTQNVNSESVSSAYLSEGSDISTNTVGSMSGAQYAGARADGDPILGLALRDFRLKCATVTVQRTGNKDNPSGVITITFDPTCTDARGDKRSGTIVINYNGKRWNPGSYINVHANFTRNDTQIAGVDSLITKMSADSTSLGYLQLQSILTDGKVTFGDGKTISRDHNLIHEWYRSTTPMNDEWHTLKGGQAAGVCKNGDTYQMSITEDLVYKNSCLIDKVFIPVSGTKALTVSAVGNTPTTYKYTVDYGDGTCDNIITVTDNNKEKAITVNAEGD